MAKKNILIREELEAKELAFLAPYATKSAETKGRLRFEEKCPLRTDFQRDRDRIVHTKAFRRLKHKTQVFIAPRGDHYRTRLTHTLEVAQISRVICRALGLNEDLAEAVALGHDLGHTPFGHSGEAVLDDCQKKIKKRFFHNEQSLRVVDVLERNYHGLNLTFEVRDGILCHPWNWKELPLTPEGQVVRMADQIAFINHDIEDALMAGIISKNELPESSLKILGRSHGERINSMVEDLIFTSKPVLEKSYPDKREIKITMGKKVKKAMDELQKFLYDKVYIGSDAKKEEEKTQEIVRTLFYYYLRFPEKIPKKYLKSYQAPLRQKVIDYVAGMTDDYAIRVFEDLFIPTPWMG